MIRNTGSRDSSVTALVILAIFLVSLVMMAFFSPVSIFTQTTTLTRVTTSQLTKGVTSTIVLSPSATIETKTSTETETQMSYLTRTYTLTLTSPTTITVYVPFSTGTEMVFKELKIVSARCDKVMLGEGRGTAFVVKISLMNSDVDSIDITQVYVNGQLLSQYRPPGVIYPVLPFTLGLKEEKEIQLWLSSFAGFEREQTIRIVFETSIGIGPAVEILLFDP